MTLGGLHGELGVNVNRAINIDDLRRMAKRRLPRIAYDFIEGGVEDELGIARNEAAFDRPTLVPDWTSHAHARTPRAADLPACAAPGTHIGQPPRIALQFGANLGNHG